jgi:hypothetical protein
MNRIPVRRAGKLLAKNPTLSLVLALVAGGLALSAAPCLRAQAAPVDKVQESVDVIRQILAKDGLYTRTTTREGTYKSKTERKYYLKSATGCQLIVANEAHVHTEMPAQQRVSDRSWTEILWPDFSVLDPANVVVQDPIPPQPNWETKGYLVRINVETGKAPIKVTAINSDSTQQREMPAMPNLGVYVTSREQADRLAKAFSQTAAACHATASAR